MGQSTSVVPGRSTVSGDFDFLHEQIRKHSSTLRQIASTLTIDDLQDKIHELNALSSKFVDCNGKQLLFAIKPGTETNVLWTVTVKIKCIKIDPSSQMVEKVRELSLKQFLQVYNTMQLQLEASKNSENAGPSFFSNIATSDDSDAHCSGTGDKGETNSKCFGLTQTSMDASVFLDKVSAPNPEGLEECCICMENKAEVSLPCAHSYCLACIEQWHDNHKTCPTCRETLETTDDTWVLEDLPDRNDVSQEIQKSLFDLTR